MTIGELINRIGFEVDEKSIGNVNKSIDSIKKNAKDISKVITDSIGEAITDINSLVDDMLVSTTDGIEGISKAFQKLTDNYKAFKNSAGLSEHTNTASNIKGKDGVNIQTDGSTLSEITDSIRDVAENIVGGFDDISGSFSVDEDDVNLVADKLEEIYNGILDGANNLIDAITGHSSSKSNGSDVKKPADENTARPKTAFKEDGKQLFDKLLSGAKDKIAPILNVLRDTVEPVTSKVKSGYGKAKNVFDGAKSSVKGKLGLDTDDASKELTIFKDKAEGVADDVLKKGTKVSNALKAVGTAVISGLVAGAKKLLSLMGIALNIRELANIAETYDKINRHLVNMTGSQEEANELQEDMLATANNLRMQYEAIGTAITGIAQANTRDNFDTEKAGQLVNMVGMVGKLAGMDDSAINGIFSQLESAAVTGGEIQGMLESWNTSAPELVSWIAKGAGQLGKVADMNKDGIVDSRELVRQAQALHLTLEDVYESLEANNEAITEMYAKMGATVSEAKTVIRNTFNSLVARINQTLGVSKYYGQKLLELFAPIEKMMKKIADYADKLKEKLNSSTNAMKAIAGAVEAIGAATGIFTLLKTVTGLSTKLSGMSGILGKLGGMLGSFSGIFTKILSLGGGKIALIVAAVAALVLLVKDLIGFMQGKDSLIGRFLSAEEGEKLRETLKNVWSLIKELVSTLVSALKPIIQAVMKIIAALVPVFATIVQVVGSLLESILPVVISLIEGLIPIIETILSVLDPILDLIIDIMDPLMEILTIVMEILEPIIELLNPIIEALLTIVNVILKPIITVIGVIVKVVGAILKIVLNAIAVILKLLQPFIDIILGIMNISLKWTAKLWSVIGKFVTWICDAVTGVADFITNIFTTISDFYKKTIGKVVDFIRAVIDLFFGWFKKKSDSNTPEKRWERVKTSFKKMFDWFKDIALNFLVFMTNPIAGVFMFFYKHSEKFKAFVDKIVGWIKNIFSKLFGWFKKDDNTDSVLKPWQKIKDFFSKIGDFFKNIFSNLFGWMKRDENAKSLTSPWEKFKDFVGRFFKWWKKVAVTMLAFFVNPLAGIFAFLYNFSDKFRGFINKIIDWFKGLKDKALTWGKDLIDNLISGITSGVQKVKDAVSNIANAIKSFLGFSEPEEGPLSDFHTYMPDMIESMSSGIKEGAGKVKNAVKNIAGVVFDGLGNGDLFALQKKTFKGIGDLITGNSTLGDMYNTITSSPSASTLTNNSSANSSIVQNINITNTFNGGDKQMQANISESADMSYNDLTYRLSQAIAMTH